MDMSLVSAASSAVSAGVNAYFANQAASHQADVANKIRDGNNDVLASVNKRNASMTALQRWRQSVSNKRVYEAVAANQEALATNFNRSRDAKTRSNFAASIRSAEESGRQQAAAAASGITGSVVDVIDNTSRLRQGMELAASRQAEAQMMSDYDKREFTQKWATLDTLDYSTIFDNQGIKDFGRNTAKHTSVFDAVVSSQLKDLGTTQKAVGAISSFFSTPDPIGDFYLRGNTGSGD